MPIHLVKGGDPMSHGLLKRSVAYFRNVRERR